MITNEPSTQHEQEQPFLPRESAVPAAPQTPEMVIGGGVPDKQGIWLDVIKAFGVWFASIVCLIVTQLAVGIPYFVYRWVTTGPPQIESLVTDKTLAFLSILSVLPAHLLTLGLIWLAIVGGRKGNFRESLKLEWPRYMSPAVGTVLCSLIAIVLYVAGASITYLWGGNKTQLDLLVESSIPTRMATAVIAVFTAPLIEELIYRGVLFSALHRAFGTVITVFVVSLLFSGVHVYQYMENVAVIAVITVLSFTLTIVRAKTGSVLAPFVIHLVFNAIQAVIIAISPFVNLGQSQ